MKGIQGPYKCELTRKLLEQLCDHLSCAKVVSVGVTATGYNQSLKQNSVGCSNPPYQEIFQSCPGNLDIPEHVCATSMAVSSCEEIRQPSCCHLAPIV